MDSVSRKTLANMNLKKYIAELIGTFALVFAGTGAIVVNDISGNALTHVGISFVFGLIVMAMIYSIGDVSGAHINPAVTIAFWIARRFEGRQVLAYLASQCLGAVLASWVVSFLLLSHSTLGATLPSGTWAQAFLMEFILTFFLMYVVLNVSTGSQEKGIMAGIAIGGFVALGALVGGPICGASMNPARSLGPALVSGQLSSLWIYLLAPTLGAAAAVVGCRCTQPGGCCSRQLASDSAACKP